MTTLDDLAAAAEEATPGPWHRHTYGHRSVRAAAGAVTRSLFANPKDIRALMTDLTWVHCDDENGPVIALTGNGPHQVENADFIAAADPTTVLRLVAVARAGQDAAEVIEREGWEVYYADERFDVSRRIRAALAALEEVR